MSLDLESLAAERKNNAGTIAGLQNRIKLSQEEIDALTARNEEIGALVRAVQAAPAGAVVEKLEAVSAPEEGQPKSRKKP